MRIGELRAKARRARELAELSSDARTLANLRSYARELDAEALHLETGLDKAVPSASPAPGDPAAGEDSAPDIKADPEEPIAP